jgi:hypothetical protein
MDPQNQEQTGLTAIHRLATYGTLPPAARTSTNSTNSTAAGWKGRSTERSPTPAGAPASATPHSHSTPTGRP